MFIILGADGKEYGPVTTGNIVEWIQAGRANLQTKARSERDPEWKTLGDFAEFGGRPGSGSAAPALIAVVQSASGKVTFAPVPAVAAADSASRWLRLLAALVDGLLKTLCYLPITIPLTRALFQQAATGLQPSFQEVTAMTKEILNANLDRALPLLAALVLTQLCLLALRGQSIGKLLVGLRIVRHPDGSAPGFLHAFLLRGFVPFLVEEIPVMGFVFWMVDSCFLFGPDRRCLHDLIAGTRVVKA